MSNDDNHSKPSKAKRVIRAVVVGVLAALLCHKLPPEHQELCRAIANVCTGGFAP